MSSWENLLSGLIGAVVGGIASVFGGLWATNRNIKSLERTEKRKSEEQVKLSAGILFEDIMSFIREIIFFGSFHKNQGYASHNADYSNHIANLRNSSFNSEDIHTLNQLYGFIMRYQKSSMETSINSTKIEIYLMVDYEKFCNAVFGSTENFRNNTATVNLDNNLNLELITRNMIPRFGSALNKLYRLKNETP